MKKGSIRVVNQRWNSDVKAEEDEVVIDISRTTNSPLQNRHPMREHSLRERDRVIDLNAEDLKVDMSKNGPMYAELKRIAAIVASGDNVALQCHCSPSRCHGENYIPVINAIADTLCSANKIPAQSDNEESELMLISA